MEWVVSSGIVAERTVRVDGDEGKSAYAMRTRGRARTRCIMRGRNSCC